MDKVSDDDWLAMPDGKLYHKSCIHYHDDEFQVESVDEGSLVNGELFEACPYETREQEVQDENVSYYSDWAVYAQMAEKRRLFSEMSSVWEVPENPKTTGPAGTSSIYLFNGLEDGGGEHGAASLIL